jgi:anti-sigma regulatory factor (Ser/Thr protein kinase)
VSHASVITHPHPIAFAEPWSYEIGFPCDPRSPRIVRIALRAILLAHGIAELIDRAELLTSELATNSVRHTKEPASVRVHWLYPVLRVSVWDMSPDLPAPSRLLDDDDAAAADGGRGLMILEVVADRWGRCGTSESPYGPGGKTIWFELALDRHEPPPALAS